MSATCPHLRQFRKPGVGVVVHREECTRCFDSDTSPNGLYVCLTCFNGGCLGEGHGLQHFAHSNHPLVLHLKKRIIPQDDVEQKNEITKLAIGVDGGALQTPGEKIEFDTETLCLACKTNVTSPELADVTQSVLKANAINFRGDEAAWEPVLEPCEHSLTLMQDPSAPVLATKNLAHCQSCDINTNLWLCLTCGALGCSRPSSGGNGHAVAHFEKTNHPLVCKMGTVSSDGTADVYCYGCDEARLDPNLAQHFGHFGINVAEQERTEKTTAQLELDLNKSHDFSEVVSTSGNKQELLFGPCNTGLVNLGNSCYMASVFQVLFSQPPFLEKYASKGRQHLQTCRVAAPADCWQCQMAKLADGLLSGRYSRKPVEPMPEIDATDEQSQKKRKKAEVQHGIPPRMIARLVTKEHAEFRSKRQQDAMEFLQFFLQQIQHQERASGHVEEDPTKVFDMKVEERLECLSCHQVRYKQVKESQLELPIPVDAAQKVSVADMQVDVKPITPSDPTKPLTAKDLERQKQREEDSRKRAAFTEERKIQVPFGACLEAWTKPDTLEYNCPTCKRTTQAHRSSRFATYPGMIVAQMRRFVRDDWLPRKVGVDVDIPETPLDLSRLRGKGLQPGEVELPASAAPAPAAAPKLTANEEHVAQLMSMGFGRNACIRAVLAVKNAGADQASEWLFSHMEDANLNDPVVDTPAAAASAPAVNEAHVAQLATMGFSVERCRHALVQTSNNFDRALDWLFSHVDDPIDVPVAGSDPSPASAAALAPEKDDGRPPVYQLAAFVTHIGPSDSSGHYIAHVMRDGRWVCFNDEKVFIDTDYAQHKRQSYILFFRKL